MKLLVIFFFIISIAEPKQKTWCTRWHTVTVNQTCRSLTSNISVYNGLVKIANGYGVSCKKPLEVGSRFCMANTKYCPPCTKNHTVVAGDTCDSIKKQYGCGDVEFQEMNEKISCKPLKAKIVCVDVFWKGWE